MHWNGNEWVADTPAAKPESRVKRVAAAALEASLITALTFGLIAGTAFAAKGGGGSRGGSITMVAPDGTANWGDQIHFAISTSNQYPVASVSCSQGGSVVYGASHPLYWPNAWEDDGTFTLSSQAWTGGGASCTALLKGTSHGKVVTLASTSFEVSP